MRVLLTGSTGVVGPALCKSLAGRGDDVLAVTRNHHSAKFPARVSIVDGDSSKPASYAEHLNGSDALFVSPRAVNKGGRDLLTMAYQARVKRVLLISALTVEFGGGEARFSDEFRSFEDLVKASGLNWTILRCADFDANARMYIPQVRQGVVRAAYPDAATACIHESDIAEVAATVLHSEEHVGKTYVITGPAPVSQREKVRAIANATGKDVRFEEISPGRAKEAMLAAGLPEEIPARLLGYLSSIDGQPAPVTQTVAELVGTPAKTFESWALEHRDEFGVDGR